MTSYASPALQDQPLADKPLPELPPLDEQTPDAAVADSDAVVARTDQPGGLAADGAPAA